MANLEVYILPWLRRRGKLKRKNLMHWHLLILLITSWTKITASKNYPFLLLMSLEQRWRCQPKALHHSGIMWWATYIHMGNGGNHDECHSMGIKEFGTNAPVCSWWSRLLVRLLVVACLLLLACCCLLLAAYHTYLCTYFSRYVILSNIKPMRITNLWCSAHWQ